VRTIFVTGGAGYIGSHTIKALEKEGYKTVVYDNLVTGHSQAVKNAELIIGDLRDVDKLDKALKKYKYDGVIHFAGSAYVGESIQNPSKYYNNNIISGINLLDCMVRNNIKNIIFSSSCATYGVPERLPITENMKQNPISPYGWTKLVFEQMMKDYESAYGLKYVALRYFNAAGADLDGELFENHDPETHIIPLILQTAMGVRDEFVVYGNQYETKDGSCIRDYIHVNDLAEAHIKALNYLLEEGISQEINLGTGVGLSVFDILQQVEQITGKKINYRVGAQRPGDPASLIADNKKAETILHWKAEYSNIRTIIQTALKYYNASLE